METYTTSKTLALSEGKYQLSIAKQVVRSKWRLPLVYVFDKWNDGCLAHSRQISLDRDLELCAKFKVSYGASLKVWRKNTWNFIASTKNRFNEFHRENSGLFWLIGFLVSLLLWVLSRFKILLQGDYFSHGKEN